MTLDPGAIDKAIARDIEICGQKMCTLELDGYRLELPGKGSPLSADYAPPKKSPAKLKFIPYYAWANRGEGEMSVWVRV